MPTWKRNKPNYKTLEQLGYYFNDRGELRLLKDHSRFLFISQSHYERVGDAMTEALYDKLCTEHGMYEAPVCQVNMDDSRYSGDFSFVLASHGYEKKNDVLVLMHGSGAVRAGQWGRRLILNESLSEGSMIPYVERAHTNGWGVVIFNMNYYEQEYSRSPKNHAINAWKRYISRHIAAQRVYVVAHSAGGAAITEVMDRLEDERVCFIALTDSWFRAYRKHKQLHVANWSAHADPSRVEKRSDIYTLYAGTPEHDRTSAAAFTSIFHVLENLGSMSMWDLLNEAIRPTSEWDSKEKRARRKWEEQEKEEERAAKEKKICEEPEWNEDLLKVLPKHVAQGDSVTDRCSEQSIVAKKKEPLRETRIDMGNGLSNTDETAGLRPSHAETEQFHDCLEEPMQVEPKRDAGTFLLNEKMPTPNHTSIPPFFDSRPTIVAVAEYEERSGPGAWHETLPNNWSTDQETAKPLDWQITGNRHVHSPLEESAASHHQLQYWNADHWTRDEQLHSSVDESSYIRDYASTSAYDRELVEPSAPPLSLPPSVAPMVAQPQPREQQNVTEQVAVVGARRLEARSGVTTPHRPLDERRESNLAMMHQNGDHRTRAEQHHYPSVDQSSCIGYYDYGSTGASYRGLVEPSAPPQSLPPSAAPIVAQPRPSAHSRVSAELVHLLIESIRLFVVGR